MPKLITEFIGTFFLVLTIGLTVMQELAMAPLAIGAILMAMIFMGGHISGAHYNPAVSLALLLRGKMELSDLIPYWLAQILGSLAAAVVAYLVLGSTFAPAPGESVSLGSAVLIEGFFTFALCLVILNVATAPATEGNSFYGIASGSTVMAGAFLGGPISGAAFNPAVAIGPSLLNAVLSEGSLSSLPIYLTAPFLGGALAASVYRLQHQGENG